MFLSVDTLYPEPSPPAPDIIKSNASGGLEGVQPLPSYSGMGGGDGSADIAELLECTNRAPDVQRSYSETAEQAYSGAYLEGYGSYGAGACLPDQTLGPNRNGYRGMADEPLPVRPAMPDLDDDFDEPSYS